MGIGKIMLAAVEGSIFNLADTFMHHGSRKTIGFQLLVVSTMAKIGLVVKFTDGRCIVHDLSHGDTIITSCMLCCGLYLTNDSESFF